MFRAGPRLIARSALPSALPRTIAPTRRYISTAPPAQKSRSFKSLVARLGIAGTIIYYYNTTDVFAEEPRHAVQTLPETESEAETYPTIDSISAERQKRKAVQAQLDAQAEARSQQQQDAPAEGAEGGIEGLEAEADQQGAFNPETGEINWDCPCLGGMATGPCGEQFKAAFSCFVYSQEEPKGMDCIDRFKDMQNCFREYPEVYGSELEGDEEDGEGDGVSSPMAVESDSASSPAPKSTNARAPSHENALAEKGKASAESNSKPASSSSSSSSGLALVPDNYKPDASEPVSESEELVPKAAHDTKDENTKVLERK